MSKTVDLDIPPSRRKDKRAKHRSSKPGVVKPSLPSPPTFQQLSIQIHDVDLFAPIEVTSSKVTAMRLFFYFEFNIIFQFEFIYY